MSIIFIFIFCFDGQQLTTLPGEGHLVLKYVLRSQQTDHFDHFLARIVFLPWLAFCFWKADSVPQLYEIGFDWVLRSHSQHDISEFFSEPQCLPACLLILMIELFAFFSIMFALAMNQEYYTLIFCFLSTLLAYRFIEQGNTYVSYLNFY